MTNSVIAKALKGQILSKAELVALLSDDDINDELFSAADSVRKENVGDTVHLRALIEFSNICKNNCLYCGIRAGNTQIKRYRLTADEIFSLAKSAKEMGLQTIVLQSAEDLDYKTADLCHIIENLKKLDVAVTLSIGEKTYTEYKAYKEAGADRYLLRIETTDKDLYHKLDPKMDWERRFDCLLALKDLKYELGTGSLIGLPSQTIESMAEDILFFKKLDADMIGVGPFIPHPDTPLKDAKGGTLAMALKVMALTRLMLPNINIPATTAMETLEEGGRVKALQSGANVIMPNITLADLSKNYALYPNKSRTPLADIKATILKLGRTIGTDKGQSKAYGLKSRL